MKTWGRPSRPGEHPGLAPFLALSAASVVVPLAEAWVGLGVADVAYVAVIFGSLLAGELLFFRAIGALLRPFRWKVPASHLVLSLFLSINTAYFFMITVNAQRSFLNASLGALAIIFLASLYVAKVRRFLVAFSMVFAAMSVGKAACLATLPAASLRTGSHVEGRPLSTGRKVYVISFDTMTSRAALREIYGIYEHPHVTVLERSGFRVTDTISAGTDTHTTLGKMFALGGEFQVRIARTFFNGVRMVPLYERLRREGYRIQFIFANTYFGVAAGQLDYFYPGVDSASVCEFVDQKYGVFACHPAFRRFVQAHTGLKVLGGGFGGERERAAEFNRIIERYRTVAVEREKWFSFAHFYFPAHAGFHYSESALHRSFMDEMRGKLPELAGYLWKIIAEIKSADPDPVIIIFGDHGGWMTRGANAGDTMGERVLTPDLLELDRRGALLAVYPKTFCAEAMGDRPDTSILFTDVLDCLRAEAAGTKPAR